jgi:hypothetical protein
LGLGSSGVVISSKVFVNASVVGEDDALAHPRWHTAYVALAIALALHHALVERLQLPAQHAGRAAVRSGGIDG